MSWGDYSDGCSITLQACSCPLGLLGFPLSEERFERECIWSDSVWHIKLQTGLFLKLSTGLTHQRYKADMCLCMCMCVHICLCEREWEMRAGNTDYGAFKSQNCFGSLRLWQQSLSQNLSSIWIFIKINEYALSMQIQVCKSLAIRSYQWCKFLFTLRIVITKWFCKKKKKKLYY